MESITIDILNEKVIMLLQDLEKLKLIRLRKGNAKPAAAIDWKAKYKGAMTKQPLDEIAWQLNELRNAWE